MARNYYAEAIAILTDPTTDFRALLIEVAKAHPKAVVDARMGLGLKEAKDLVDKMVA